MRGLAALFLALAWLASAIVPTRADERILRFVSDVVVERNGELLVTETIRLRAEGREIRRGIVRDFPTIYRRDDGAMVNVGFDVLSVVRDGWPERYSLDRKQNGWSIRIGDPDKLLATTQHEYVIRYRTRRQLGFFAEYDELYWNATGNGWTFTIDEAEARITLPEAVPLRKSAFYTGPQGARGQGARIVEEAPGRIVFRTSRPLPPSNGLTVATSWPKGIVLPPSAMQQTIWLLQDNPALGAAAVGLPLVFGFYVLAWLLVGRDPPRGTIIPLFAPPDNMSAAAARYVDRMGFDDKCFTVAIIDLGVRGHVKLSGSGSSTIIYRRNGGQAIARPEQDVKSKLFASNSSLQLSQTNHEPIGKAKSALRDGLIAAFGDKLFTNNYVWSGAGFLAAAALIGIIAWLMATSYGPDQVKPMGAGMLAPLVFIMGGAVAVRAGIRRGDSGRVFLVSGLVLMTLAAALGFALMFSHARGWVEVLPGVAAYILAPLAALGFRWLQAPTRSGRQVMDRIEGFRQYLGVAEEDRLEFLHPPEKTPELFERFLPYAVALDVENTWAKRFAGVLAAAGVGAAAAAGSSWYSNESGSASDPVSFAQHLSGDLSSTIASSATPPGSSSGSDGGGSSDSGGGGSSGDGGGGGGGSGW
jgi:uncharacterized membrane protein YgcG